jgi:hypothetical protein
MIWTREFFAVDAQTSWIEKLTFGTVITTTTPAPIWYYSKVTAISSPFLLEKFASHLVHQQHMQIEDISVQ